MATEIYVCLDLGNDTLKVSYSYGYKGAEAYGKLMMPDLVNQVAFPAAAIYDDVGRKWKFAEEVENSEKQGLSFVVKIKTLLSLVAEQTDKTIEDRNRDYYYCKYYFPKFSFPVRRRMKDDFEYMVEQKLVFEAPGFTPAKMCELFFVHIREKISERIDELSAKTGIQFEKLRYISIVHPPKQGIDYATELSRLINCAFGVRPTKILTTTQALGLLSFHKGYLNSSDRLLLFDMGDETISVTKVWLNEVGKNAGGSGHGKIGILMDSPAGHSPPLELGGCNIDESISDFLDSCIHDRETVGSPSAGKQGHIYEDGLCAEQYLLMKDIKKAKMLMPLSGSGMFEEGVPISVHRETLVQRMLSEEDFLDCVGISYNQGIANRVFNYLKEEMSRPGNRDVTKILFSGGMIETHGLRDFIGKFIKENYPNISILNMESTFKGNDIYSINNYEMSTYASSVGGAIVAMRNYSVDAVLSYSYGTWLYHGYDKKHLKLFAERGDLLLNDINYFFMEAVICVGTKVMDRIDGDEMFSTVINSEEIKRRLYSDKLTYDEDWLVIGNSGDHERLAAEDVIDLKVVAGGENTEIQFYYHDRRVAVSNSYDVELWFAEGFKIDQNGHATPFFDNIKEKNAQYTIRIHDMYSNYTENINAADLEFRLSMNSITVATNT